jgi:Pyruvate/2-oxoacid:ferredoxin oxidoreductase delta subunit
VIPGASNALRVVVYEGEGSRPLDEGQRFDLLRTLLEKGYAVTRTRSGGAVSGPGESGGTMVVLGRFDRRQFAQANGAAGDLKLHFRDIEGQPTAECVETVESIRGEAQAPKPGGWKPWFPVIDYKRCTNCMQCMSFCLFDVYGVSTEGKIKVQNQNNCKTDCPACSRVCPEVAILFPKYRFGPINGDEVSSDDVRREAMKVDISALLGGDIYSALRDRSEKAKSRFSKERDEDRALKERNRCLEKLQKNLGEMDIPAEVLSSLPSPDQIREKAAQAKARAEEALKLANSAHAPAVGSPASAGVSSTGHSSTPNPGASPS